MRNEFDRFQKLAAKLFIVVGLVVVSGSPIRGEQLLTLNLPDGESTVGKLRLPDDNEVRTLIVFVHGTGPNTHENPREIGGKSFKYYDLIGDEFARRGVAFFSYNRRGVEIGPNPPYFDKIDREKYKKCVPSIEVEDFSTMLKQLRSHPKLGKAKIILLGWSEGTMIASLVAEKKANDIAALMLCGYANDNLFDIIKWQYSGVGSMLNLCPAFDTDKDGTISRDEYQSDERLPKVWRERVLKGAKFQALDRDQDGDLTKEDFRIAAEPAYQQILQRIRDNDADWIWENYFRVSIEWLNEHFELEPNKERVPRLDIPIHIFHGDRDANTDVGGVYDVAERFKKAGKDNLTTHIFAGHDHDLNVHDWVLKEKMPPAFEKIYEVAETLDR